MHFINNKCFHHDLFKAHLHAEHATEVVCILFRWL